MASNATMAHGHIWTFQKMIRQQQSSNFPPNAQTTRSFIPMIWTSALPNMGIPAAAFLEIEAVVLSTDTA